MYRGPSWRKEGMYLGPEGDLRIPVHQALLIHEGMSLILWLTSIEKELPSDLKDEENNGMKTPALLFVLETENCAMAFPVCHSHLMHSLSESNSALI